MVIDGFTNPLDLSDYPFTSPVDHYPAYGYGMNDMAGNVWEWTDSIYSGSDLVIRGGSWANSGDYCTVWSSLGDSPTRTASDIGFRVCR